MGARTGRRYRGFTRASFFFVWSFWVSFFFRPFIFWYVERNMEKKRRKFSGLFALARPRKSSRLVRQMLCFQSSLLFKWGSDLTNRYPSTLEKKSIKVFKLPIFMKCQRLDPRPRERERERCALRLSFRSLPDVLVPGLFLLFWTPELRF